MTNFSAASPKGTIFGTATHSGNGNVSTVRGGGRCVDVFIPSECALGCRFVTVSKCISVYCECYCYNVGVIIIRVSLIVKELFTCDLVSKYMVIIYRLLFC